MRQPRNHSEVAHQWASREVESGSNGNMSFAAGRILSYHWWPMAEFFKTESSEEYVIMTGWSYSSSTSKHLGYVRHAIPKNIPVYYSNVRSTSYYGQGKGSPVLTNKAVLETMLDSIKASYDEFFVLKNHQKNSVDTFIKHNLGIYVGAKKFCELTGIKLDQNFDKYLLSESEIQIVHRMLVPYEAELAVKRDKANKLAEIRDAAREIVYARYGMSEFEMAKLWIREGGVDQKRYWFGQGIKLPQGDPDVKRSGLKSIEKRMDTAMRIEGDQIITNMGARISLAAGMRLWGMMKRNEPVIGEKCDIYTVLKCNGELVIGCHHIKREIVDYFVEYYGW